MTSHEGIVFHAGAVDVSVRAFEAIGRWVAASTSACVFGRPFASTCMKTAGLRYQSVTPFGAPGNGTKLNSAGGFKGGSDEPFGGVRIWRMLSPCVGMNAST